MSAPHDRGTPVLVDTNVIIEAHRTRSWRALSRGCRVETVEACVAETQTGFQLRRKEQEINAADLRESLAAVHSVSARERVELMVRKGNIAALGSEAGVGVRELHRAIFRGVLLY